MRNHYLRKIVKSAQKECVKDFCTEKKQHSGGVSCCQNAVSASLTVPVSSQTSVQILFPYRYIHS